MGEHTIGELVNQTRTMDEESTVFRDLLQALTMASESGKGLTTLLSGITDGCGNFGLFDDFLRMSGTGKEDIDEERKSKACIKAIDAQVISQEGDVGDLWQFVIEASDGKKISVSGWAY